MRVFVGMETSGRSRRAFQALGHWVVSCDLLPSQDGSVYSDTNGGHVQGDVFAVLAAFAERGIVFDLAIFHPDCTYLTGSAEWAYGDGPYHQKVKPGTLVGAARRAAREDALNTVRRIMALPIERIAIENPVGCISSRIRKPDQIIQPYEFGDDASKKTCLWLKGLPKLRHTHTGFPVASSSIKATPSNAGRTRPTVGKTACRHPTIGGRSGATPIPALRPRLLCSGEEPVRGSSSFTHLFNKRLSDVQNL